MRQLNVKGSAIREWSCTFVHRDHAYRFVTYVPSDEVEAEAYLRTIVEAAEVE